MTSAATAPERSLIRRAWVALALGTVALLACLVAPGGAPASAQLLPTTSEPPTTTEPVPETTEPPTTTEPVPETTEAPATTGPPATAPPTTRSTSTTERTEATPPPETTTTAPPSAPSTIPVTTVPTEGRTRITQDTPDLGGILTLWGLGILGTVATLAWGWWRNRR